MIVVFVLLILALLAKDATPLGDRYVLRALSEGVALLVGVGWLAMSGIREVTWRHAVLGLYIGALVFAIPQAASPLYVALQIIALIAVVLFSLAFMGAALRNTQLTHHATRAMLVGLTVVCIASLVVRYWHPGMTYELTFEGPRFRGLFSKPAMMGAASGLLLGLGLFVTWTWWMRVIALAASVPCLILTGSRTFWAAAMVSMGVVALRYVRWRWTFVPVGAVIIAGTVFIGILADMRVTPELQAKMFRQDSLETFSGRTSMWVQALHQYWEHPWLGHGFTAGGAVLDEGNRPGTVVLSSASPSQGAVTLHNGYLQALLDSGIVGAAMYVTVIMSALACFFLYDKGRRYAAEFYCLLFLAVANFGETIIFGAAVLHGVWFWYLTVLALTLPSLCQGEPFASRHGNESGGTDRDDSLSHTATVPVRTPRRYPILQPKEAT